MEELPEKLIYQTDDAAGFRRKRRGRGFVYYNPRGEKVDKTALPRHLQGLYVPPAWTDVWLSAKANGHLQATGFDEQKRKQYVYHPAWNEHRQLAKFSSLESFAKALPQIRKKIYTDLQEEGWPRHKVVALVVALLDASYMRIGNAAYQEAHGTFGLTTLRRKHLRAEDSLVVFTYKGKSGVMRNVQLEDPELVALLKECSALPGYELFRYQENGHSHTVDSEDVNVYLREVSGQSFTSKTFRTWGGTVLAVELFPAACKVVEENPKRELISCLVQLTAERLGNTPSVCRSYYIHPAILDAVEQGSLGEYLSRTRVRDSQSFGLDRHEKMALKIIKAWREKQLSQHRQAS
jgi:DNA topoisomerase-1